MENPRGRVIALNGGDPSPHALIEVDAAVPCARCAEGKGCGAGLTGGPAGRRRIDATIAAGLTISEGDEVRIELAPRNLLRASLVVYGAPLAGAVIAALLAFLLRFEDLYAAITAVTGVVAGVLFARSRLRRTACLRSLTPTVVERLAASGVSAGIR